MEAQIRDMSERERALVGRLLGQPFTGSEELLQQLESAKVRPIDEDGCLEFLVTGGPTADHLKSRVPVEGEYEDPDGVTVHVLLHVVRGRAKVLEFFREDNANVHTWPEADRMRITVLG